MSRATQQIKPDDSDKALRLFLANLVLAMVSVSLIMLGVYRWGQSDVIDMILQSLIELIPLYFLFSLLITSFAIMKGSK